MGKHSKVLLSGSSADPETKKSAAKIKKAGRKVETGHNPSIDGTGPCGLICSCNEVCVNRIAYPEENGAFTY